MSWFTQVKDESAADDVTRSILWPFVFWPLIWIALIHVGTRLMWFFGVK